MQPDVIEIRNDRMIFSTLRIYKGNDDVQLDILPPSGRKSAELKTIQNPLGDFNLITLKL
jgi:hypothetical protein